eukprot:648653-Amphidinium_carterae.1
MSDIQGDPLVSLSFGGRLSLGIFTAQLHFSLEAVRKKLTRKSVRCGKPAQLGEQQLGNQTSIGVP